MKTQYGEFIFDISVKSLASNKEMAYVLLVNEEKQVCLFLQTFIIVGTFLFLKLLFTKQVSRLLCSMICD